MTRLTMPVMLRATPADPRVLRGGVVVSVDSGAAWSARVRLDDYPDDVTVPAMRHVDLTDVGPGDVALLLVDRQRLIMVGATGKPSEPAPEPPPTPDEPPPPDDPEPPRVLTATARPTATGSARSGSWRPDTDKVLQGDWTGRGVNTGAAFYGTRLSRLSGSCTRLQVRVQRLDGGYYGAQPLTMRLWAQSGPTGAPTSRASTAGPSLAVGQSATVTLPTSWGQQLLDGSAGGLGIYVASSHPYVVTAGLSASSTAWTVTLTYREREG